MLITSVQVERLIPGRGYENKRGSKGVYSSDNTPSGDFISYYKFDEGSWTTAGDSVFLLKKATKE
jgi:hypothetical protein